MSGKFRGVKVIPRRALGDNRPFEREFEGIQRYEPISRSHESQVQILHVGINQSAGYFYYVMELADEGEVPSAKCQVSGDASKGSDDAADNPDTSHLTPDTYVPRTLRLELERHSRLPL